MTHPYILRARQPTRRVSVDQKERQVIDDLFGKLRQVEGQSPQRDPEAEAYIGRQVASLPTAPYYMAQAILVQEQALASLQSRVQQLEHQIAQRPAAGAGGGGFLSSIFGGGGQSTQPAPRQPAPPPPYAPPSYMQPGGHGGYGHGSPWGGGGYRGGMGGGGGFLAGAMQTALGVAGGMLVADAISDAFSGGAAEATDLATGAADQAGDALGLDQGGGAMEADPVAYEDPGFDAGGDFGGDEEV
jgi:uncharacterized protein